VCGKTVHRSSMNQWEPTIVSFCPEPKDLIRPLFPRDYLGSVLPGLSDFQLNRITELAPAAWPKRKHIGDDAAIVRGVVSKTLTVLLFKSSGGGLHSQRSYCRSSFRAL